MKKRKDTTAEDRLFVAERQYNRMMDNVTNGIIDRDEIVAAMTIINTAHYIALKENKAHLIK